MQWERRRAFYNVADNLNYFRLPTEKLRAEDLANSAGEAGENV